MSDYCEDCKVEDESFKEYTCAGCRQIAIQERNAARARVSLLEGKLEALKQKNEQLQADLESSRNSVAQLCTGDIRPVPSSNQIINHGLEKERAAARAEADQFRARIAVFKEKYYEHLQYVLDGHGPSDAHAMVLSLEDDVMGLDAEKFEIVRVKAPQTYSHPVAHIVFENKENPYNGYPVGHATEFLIIKRS